MSLTYSDLYFSSFPDATDTFSYFSDPTAEEVPLIKQYQSYFNSGNLTAAGKILEDNPNLRNKIINANNLNKFVDAIKAMQRFYMQDVRNYLMELVTYRGLYSSKVSYTKYDIIIYNGLAYMCSDFNCPVGTPVANTNWFIPLSIVGEKGDSGLGLSPRGIWDSNTQYYTDDLVAYNNVLWAAHTDNINANPSDDSSIWYAVLSLNIVLEELKMSNNEIDDIINGIAEPKDDDTGTI